MTVAAKTGSRAGATHRDPAWPVREGHEVEDVASSLRCSDVRTRCQSTPKRVIQAAGCPMRSASDCVPYAIVGPAVEMPSNPLWIGAVSGSWTQLSPASGE